TQHECTADFTCANPAASPGPCAGGCALRDLARPHAVATFRASDDWPTRNAHECFGVRFDGDERGNVACDYAGAAARNAVCLPVKAVAASYAFAARPGAVAGSCISRSGG